MKTISKLLRGGIVPGIVMLLGTGSSAVLAQEPCPGSDGDIGECKVLIEINSTDGDIGFHFLIDAEDANEIRMDDPSGQKVFEDQAFGPLHEQKMTETFVESAEPLCWADPEADDDELENVTSLRAFRDIWAPGTYDIRVKGDDGEKVTGETVLTYDLPAAPKMLGFDGSIITWMQGDDLGRCAPLADEGFGVETVGEVLDIIADPALVEVAAYEIVLEPDVEDGDPVADEVFSVRVSGSINPLAVEVPASYLNSLPDDTPAKIEIGAIGLDDNATFTEVDGFCINEQEGCEDEDD